MKISNEDYEMMLSAAWNAFENTLLLWKVSRKEVDTFREEMIKKGGYYTVDSSLNTVIKGEE